MTDDDYYEVGYKEGRADAADEIERLRAQVAMLREALEPFATALQGNYSHQQDHYKIHAGGGRYDLRFSFELGDFRRARAALEKTK